MKYHKSANSKKRFLVARTFICEEVTGGVFYVAYRSFLVKGKDIRGLSEYNRILRWNIWYRIGFAELFP
jgi:hypothetical protein